MNSVESHYERLLAPAYAWMLGGDIRALADADARMFADVGLLETSGREIAVDLGAGSGAGSLALAAVGFRRVLAVDTSATLLAELAEHATGVPAIEPLHADLRSALARFVEPASVGAIVCLGDTLTHLSELDDIVRSLGQAYDALEPGGRLLISYRDLSGPLDEPGRFLLVRGDAARVLTCYLEPRSADTVVVHDLLHRRRGDEWTLETSAYPKLRIPLAWLLEQADRAGLLVRSCRSTKSGLTLVDLERPAAPSG
jgi:SAM-dependent methyltransferase